MKSGYIYLDELEMQLIKSLLIKNKDNVSVSLLNKLDYYKNVSSNDKKLKLSNSYKTLAIEKIKALSSGGFDDEEFTVDDDALVSVMNNGAYVHTWVWVENATKPKRTRKKNV